MIGDNPAARLLAILEEGMKHPQKESCRRVWQQLLGVDNSSEALLIARLGKVMELPNQTVEILRRGFPNQSTTYEHWAKQIGKGFSLQNLDSEWHSFRAHIDQHTLTYLRLTADLINTKEPSQALEEKTIVSLRERVNNLLAEALAWDVDEDVRKFAVRILQRLLVALDEYTISGAVPLMDAVEIAFGHANFDIKYRERVTSSTFGEKFVQFLSAVAASVTIVLGAPQLPDQFQLMLDKLK